MTLIAIVPAIVAYRQRKGAVVGSISRVAVVGIAVIVPVGWIGLFEGGYYHVLKDMLNVAGVREVLLLKLFPPQLYECLVTFSSK